MCYICAIIGGLAHLARALRWQRRGGRFESDILHKTIFSPFIDLKGLFYAKKRLLLRYFSTVLALLILIKLILSTLFYCFLILLLPVLNNNLALKYFEFSFFRLFSHCFKWIINLANY